MLPNKTPNKANSLIKCNVLFSQSQRVEFKKEIKF